MKTLARKIVRKVRSIVRPYYSIKSKVGRAVISINSNDERFKNYWLNYIYDLERYLSFSTTIELPSHFENVKSRITAHYHVIEKGLSFCETRLGYGRDVIDSLLNLLDLYVENGYPTDDEQFLSALRVLEEYYKFHEIHNYDVLYLQEHLTRYQQYLVEAKVGGGAITVLKDDVLSDLKKDFKHLAHSRHSIRHFAEGNVEISTIMEAIKIAQKSPSVCNRQSSFIYVLSDPTAKQQALSCQNGNRGFGHLADKILIVTTNLRAFYGIEERNQAFVDGGMFGMSLVYALHSLGLGTCTLNWSAPKERDMKLRSLIEIGEEEVVIFMIAVGLLPETFKVAFSQRKSLEDVVKVI